MSMRYAATVMLMFQFVLNWRSRWSMSDVMSNEQLKLGDVIRALAALLGLGKEPSLHTKYCQTSPR